MADGKYYWLKLKRDFFKRHDIQIIEAMPNGKEYILFYLKLLCESVDHEGSLRFSDEVPYNEIMLATITNTNVDIVRSAIKFFTDLHMMEIMDDGTYFMREVDRMIGSAADNDHAKRQQRYRERQKLLAISTECHADVTESDESVTKSDESKSKRIEKEIDIYNTDFSAEKSGEKEKKSPNPMPKFQEFVDLYHQLCPSLPKVQKLTEGRKSAIKARWLEYPDIETFKSVFTKCENNQFMKGKNDRNWVANFDFIFQASSFTKIVEGFYDKMGGATPTTQATQATPKKPLLEGSSFDTTDFYAAALKRTSGGK